MKVRNRILYLRQTEEMRSTRTVDFLDTQIEVDSGPLLFDQVLDALHDALCARVGRSEPLPNWPNGEWQEGGFAYHASNWSAEEFIDDRLAQIRFVEQVGNVTWTLNVTLGSNDAKQVIIQEQCEAQSTRHPLPVDEAPTLLTFLSQYVCEDVDQMVAGRLIRLAKDRAPAFLEFVKEPPTERALPILLITPRHADGEYALQNLRALAASLQGLAHVVVLANESKWYGDDLPLSPATYNGAVRIYMPRYAEGQGAGIHRLWMPDRIAELGEAAVMLEIVRLVNERNALQAHEHESLRHLMEARDQESIKKKIEVEVQAAREVDKKRIQQEYDALRQRLKSEVNAEAKAEFEALFDTLMQENQTLQTDYTLIVAEKERLENDNRKLHDEIRSLNFRMRKRWSEPEKAPVEPPSRPMLYLSAQAWAIYNGLDQGLRLSVENQLWHKLSDAALRDSQSEVVGCQDGTSYVFPRSRNADGKRVVYMLEGERVKVCELFMHHDQYDAARTRGFELAKYQEFVPWEPVRLRLVA